MRKEADGQVLRGAWELGLVNEMERRPDARRHDLVDGTKLQQRSLDNPDPASVVVC